MIEYSRVTFLPAGATRTRSIWAIRQSAHVWTVVTRGGERTNEIVIASPHEVVVRPAHMNLKYAELEVTN